MNKILKSLVEMVVEALKFSLCTLTGIPLLLCFAELTYYYPKYSDIFLIIGIATQTVYCIVLQEKLKNK